MLLRWLLNTYLKQAAQEKIMEAVTDAARGQIGAASATTDEERPPPCELVFVFALGVESGGFVDLLKDTKRTRYPTWVEHSGILGERHISVVDAGVGREAAARAAAEAIAVHRPAWVVSAGFAEALVDELKRGHFLLADSVCDASGQSLEIGLRLAADAPSKPNWHVGKLFTVDKIIRKVSERRELAETTGALACDMETLAIAEVCARERTRLVSVRIVSDAVEDKLPREIDRLLTRKTLAAKLGAATGALLNRPSSAMDLWKLREDALRASDRLAKFLVSVAEQLPSV